MLFKNKETGVTWDVQNPEHIKRCSKDSNYVKVEVKKEQPKKEEVKQEETPKKTTTKRTTTRKSTTTK